MKLRSLLICLLLILPAAAQQGKGSAFLGVDDSMQGWKPVCIRPTCNPGGSGIPTATEQSINHSSPSQDGESMKVSITGPSYSNALWTQIAQRNDAATKFSLSAWVYPSTNASRAGSYEYDLFQFSSSTGIEFMWGTQCDQADGWWDVFDQLNNRWIQTKIPCSLPANQWSYIRWNVHRVAGDTNKCSGKPCMYYDTLIVNNVVYGVYLKYPAGTLPHGWSSANGFQVQIDIGATNQNITVDEFLDLADFSAL